MKNVHITLTPFLHESRVLKEIRSLLENGIVSQVVVIAIWRSGLKKSESLGENIKVIRVNAYLVYVIKKLIGIDDISFNKLLIILLSYHLLFLKPDIVNIHHVNALGLVRLRRILRKCLFIYDAHELETETQSSIGKWKDYRKKLEAKYVSKIDHTFVVTPSIENWYRKTYGITTITTVMNTPQKHGNVKSKDIFRKEYKLDDDDTIFIYQGSLFSGRGIEVLLEVFEKIEDKRNHIIFMGDGELDTLIQQYEERNGNIHFREAVDPSQIIEHTASADVGISLIENVCLSYFYCLPNKIFEYAMAEIPMIVSNMQDMSNYVQDNQLGIVVDPDSLEEVAQSIKKMAQEKDNYKETLVRAKDLYNWQNEQEKMIHAYRRLLN